MPVNVIDVIKPKNNGSFPVVEDVDVKMSDGTRLSAAIGNKANKSELNSKADKSSTYTKSEVDNKIASAKADAYTKSESDNKYATKSDLTNKADTSTVSELQSEVENKADKSDVSELQSVISTKADKATTDDIQNQIDSFDKTPEVDEVVNARNSSDGTAHPNLKSRLDIEHTSLKEDLDELSELKEKTIFVEKSEQYQTGYRYGFFGENGISSASHSSHRTAFKLPIGSRMIQIVPAAGKKARVTAFSEIPSFTNEADNSNIYVWSSGLTANPISFEASDKYYYYVDTNVTIDENIEALQPQIISESFVLAKLNQKANVSDLETKVDKEEGKELSTNDYTDEDKEAVSTIPVKYKYAADGYNYIDVSEYKSNYDIGKIVPSTTDEGNPVANIVETGNWKTTKMIPCKKGGILKLDTNATLGQIAFFDVENDYSSLVFLSHESINANSEAEIDVFGNFMTFGFNSTRDELLLPNTYQKEKGNSFTAVTKFADDEKSLYDKVIAEMDENTIVFSCVADTHFNEYQTRGYYQERSASDFMKISENMGVDFALHLGDMVDENYWGTKNEAREANELHLKKMMYRYKNSNVPFVYTQGHHELYPLLEHGDGINKWRLSREKCNGICGRYAKHLNTTYHESSSSKYIDFDMQGIRLIILDSCSWGANGFSTDVLAFLDKALETDYSIVVSSHCATRQYGDVEVSQGEKVERKLLNHIASGGKVIAHLHGHYHRDGYTIVSSGDSRYPLISMTCGAVESNMETIDGFNNFIPSERSYGDISEYAFDVFCINAKTESVKAFRFGAGQDRTFD